MRFQRHNRQVFCTSVIQECQLIKFLQEIFPRHQIEIKDIWFLFVFMKIRVDVFEGQLIL